MIRKNWAYLGKIYLKWACLLDFNVIFPLHCRMLHNYLGRGINIALMRSSLYPVCGQLDEVCDVTVICASGREYLLP